MGFYLDSLSEPFQSEAMKWMANMKFTNGQFEMGHVMSNVCGRSHWYEVDYNMFESSI